MIKLEIEIMINAINARNGIVIKPNQLIYWPVHGTMPQEIEFSAKKLTF
jgi:hypothetical protein